MPTHAWDSSTYYKIIVPTPETPQCRFTQYLAIVCLQEFDERDYRQEEWLRDDSGVVSFDSVHDAREYLAATVAAKFIRPEDREIQNHVDQYR